MSNAISISMLTVSPKEIGRLQLVVAFAESNFRLFVSRKILTTRMPCGFVV